MVDWPLLGTLSYDASLLISSLAAFRFGGTDERICATILIIGSGATALVFPVMNGLLHLRARLGFLLVDIALLVAFDWLMIKSKRTWPIWITGFQIAAVAVSLVAILDPPSARRYVLVQGKFAYLMFAALIAGSLRQWRRKRSR